MAVSAWWPGGRTAQKALRASPAMTRSTALTAAPAARRAAVSEPGERKVSASSAAKPRAGTRACSAARWRPGWARRSCGVLGERRLDPDEAGELLGAERGEDRLQPLDPLGVPRRVEVAEAVGMGEERRRHRRSLGGGRRGFNAGPRRACPRPEAGRLLDDELGVQRAGRLDRLQDVDHVAGRDAERVEAGDHLGQRDRVLDDARARCPGPPRSRRRCAGSPRSRRRRRGWAAPPAAPPRPGASGCPGSPPPG